MKSVEFASLLCSRLCHDLLSPVGALNNGIELLADEQDPEMRARCLALLSESARASANKLKFFRLAFGAAGGFGDDVDTREARAAIEGLFGGDGRVQLGWMVDDGSLNKTAIKVSKVSKEYLALASKEIKAIKVSKASKVSASRAIKASKVSKEYLALMV